MEYSKKTKRLMTMLLGLAMSMNDNGYMVDRREQYNELTDEEKSELSRRIKEQREKKKNERLKEQGVNGWVYCRKDKNGNDVTEVIYAINKKNADRKAKNKGYFILAKPKI